MVFHIHYHCVNMAKVCLLDSQMTIIFIILIQSYTQESVKKRNSNISVHHILCEDWVIFETTGSMSELSLPLSGMWHHVVWWVGSRILDKCATSIYRVKDICIYLTNYTYHITEAMQRDPCIFQEYVFARTSCYVGKGSYEEWMTCQKIAVLIYKTVRTLICIQ